MILRHGLLSSQVDARNVDGSTPLCDACSAGSLECVRLLLERGAKANPALTSRTASPLHEACMGGKFFCFDIALYMYFFVTQYFPAICLPGNADCVELLITMDACLEAYDLYYGTPLHVACANDYTECVKVLLNAGKCHWVRKCTKEPGFFNSAPVCLFAAF